MTARLTSLVGKFDNLELVRAQIATILLEETAAQQAIAGAAPCSYTRADDSDYTATATVDSGQHLEEGTYTVTAGTLVAGVGEWTCAAPSGVTEQFTTSAADDDLEFPTLGITFDVTAVAEPFDTGDVLTVWSPDPRFWKLRVFSDRARPWDEWTEHPDVLADAAAPIVNIGFDEDMVDESKSDRIERQHCDARFALDVYGYGVSTETAAGHTPGDVAAAEQALRGVRLVRNYLQASTYTYLNMRETVSGRMVTARKRWPPTWETQQELATLNVVAWRLMFDVGFHELSPQYEPATIESLRFTVSRSPTGEWFQLQYDSE